MLNTIAAIALTLGAAIGSPDLDNTLSTAGTSVRPIILVQARVPPTGMVEAEKSTAAQERMQQRFPQPVRVGDLIGLPVLDPGRRTIGYVRHVVRTTGNSIDLIVAYGGWFGWETRLVAVPIEVVGIMGREIASLDMPRSDYAAAPTWDDPNATPLPDDASIQIPLARH
jgi:hypothetical protein